MNAPNPFDAQVLSVSPAEALQLIDVRVLDHLIIGDTQEYSFAETGRL